MVRPRMAVIPRLLAMASYSLAALGAFLLYRVLEAMRISESAGIAAVAGGLAEADVPVLVGLYAAIASGFITIIDRWDSQMPIDVQAYLNRIGYEGPLEPAAQTLRELQLAHLRTVPFENLSIHSNEPIVLEDAALFEKVVQRRRGGFCYELNGLFAALLRSLGFEVEMLSAAVARPTGGFGPDFDHMTLLVTLDQRWIADVGFGDSFIEPLLLDETGEQTQGARAYKFVTDGDHRILMQRNYDGTWAPQYRFTLTPHVYEDYEAMCEYQQISPESHFTKGRICTRSTPTGRITLSELRLITTRNAGERVEETLSEDEYATALREHFGIVMPKTPG